MIAEGSSKLASVPSGGAAPAASSGGAAAAGGAAEPAAEEKKEEAKEGEFPSPIPGLSDEVRESADRRSAYSSVAFLAESDDDMGFGLFD